MTIKRILFTGGSGKALVNELVRLHPFHKVVLIRRRRVDYENAEMKQLVRLNRLEF